MGLSWCIVTWKVKYRRASQWRHNERHGVSNYQNPDCLLSRLFRHTSKKTSKLRVTGLCEGNPPVPGGSPQKVSVTRKMFPFDDVIMNSCYEVDHTFQTVITSHRMMTSSNGNLLRVTGHLSGEFTGPGEFPTQRPVTRSFDVFFDLRLNKWLSKQWWGWWFEMLSCPLRRHCNGMYGFFIGFECPIKPLSHSTAIPRRWHGDLKFLRAPWDRTKMLKKYSE